MKPVATIGSMHVCPMCTGTVPHVGGPVAGPGQPNILMNGKPVAVMGDICTCAGPPDTIVTGNPNILMNGVPVACVGDMTAHGGAIIVGEPNILMGTATPVKSSVKPVKEIPFPKVVMPVREIPFPKNSIVNQTLAILSGNGKSLKEAQKNQEQLKEDAKNHGYLPDFAFSV